MTNGYSTGRGRDSIYRETETRRRTQALMKAALSDPGCTRGARPKVGERRSKRMATRRRRGQSSLLAGPGQEASRGGDAEPNGHPRSADDADPKNGRALPEGEGSGSRGQETDPDLVTPR